MNNASTIFRYAGTSCRISRRVETYCAMQGALVDSEEVESQEGLKRIRRKHLNVALYDAGRISRRVENGAPPEALGVLPYAECRISRRVET